MTVSIQCRPNGTDKPRARLSAVDLERLSRLARSAEHAMPDVAAALGEELDRAQVLKPGRYPIDVVCMGSEVMYREETSGQVQTVVLVYPEDADSEHGRVSVLTPVGAALIGLSEGSAMNWETRSGEMKRLTVLRARDPDPAQPPTSPVATPPRGRE